MVTWNNPAFRLLVDIGTGTCPHSGVSLANDLGTESPMTVSYQENGGDLATVTWSPPVLFFPDGSATDAEIAITDTDGRSTGLCVRGLTGAASVSTPSQ